MTGASREHHGERHAGSLAATAGDLVALPRRPAVGSDVYLVGGEEAVHGGGEVDQGTGATDAGGRFVVSSLGRQRVGSNQLGTGAGRTIGPRSGWRGK